MKPNQLSGAAAAPIVPRHADGAVFYNMRWQSEITG